MQAGEGDLQAILLSCVANANQVRLRQIPVSSQEIGVWPIGATAPSDERLYVFAEVQGRVQGSGERVLHDSEGTRGLQSELQQGEIETVLGEVHNRQISIIWF